MILGPGACLLPTFLVGLGHVISRMTEAVFPPSPRSLPALEIQIYNSVGSRGESVGCPAWPSALGFLGSVGLCFSTPGTLPQPCGVALILAFWGGAAESLAPALGRPGGWLWSLSS